MTVSSPSPTVSVALATYNGERYIDEQLDSLLAQTVLPCELVVSDDGSTDGTLARVRAFAERAPFPVRILDKTERLGFADNFLHAAEQCSGDLIVFCDQDDVWQPGKIAVARDRVVADDSLLTMHRLELVDAELNHIGLYDQGIAGDQVFQPLEIDPYYIGSGNSMLFRRELLRVFPRARRPLQPGETRQMGHDHWLYVLAAALGRVSHIAEPLLRYRQHGTNWGGITVPSRLARLRRILANPTEGFAAKIPYDAALAAVFDEVAAQGDPRWHKPAGDAASRFARRSEHMRHRLQVYDRPHLPGRAAAFAAMLRTLASDRAASRRALKPALKDLVLGVAGLARFGRPS
jgi:glycosyltransferase involved in cell wall biosynthesis